MDDLVTRDVEYAHDGTRMIGQLCAPPAAAGNPGVLLVHDAFGLSTDMTAVASRLARLGHAVFAADVWGGRALPESEDEIGLHIGRMVHDRARWLGRVAAAHAAAAAQPEIDTARLVALGYCFGGSTALEYVRTGGAVLGAVAVHPGLDLLDPDWSAPRTSARVLVCTGARDPMATSSMRAELEDAMTGAGVEWEVHLYSGAKHAFTSPRAKYSPVPDVVAYDERASARSWDATTRFLAELLDPVAS